MSATPNTYEFNPERWTYMAHVIQYYIRNSWQRGITKQLPLGILADLKRLIYLTLKGYHNGPYDAVDNIYECLNTFHALNQISDNACSASGIGHHPYHLDYFLKILENFLVVLEYSKVPTVILTPDALNFLQTFFHELELLREQEREKQRVEDCDE